jgi:hypothetical protein
MSSAGLGVEQSPFTLDKDDVSGDKTDADSTLAFPIDISDENHDETARDAARKPAASPGPSSVSRANKPSRFL